MNLRDALMEWEHEMRRLLRAVDSSADLLTDYERGVVDGIADVTNGLTSILYYEDHE